MTDCSLSTHNKNECLSAAVFSFYISVLFIPSRSKQLEKDLFELPELKKDEDDDPFSSGDSDREDLLAELNIDNSTDIHNVDVEAHKFKGLPKTKQYEVLMELRERRKQNNWAKIHEMPTEANDFAGTRI